MVDEGFYMALEDSEQEQSTEWKITDDQAAEWAIGKIKDAQAEVEKWETYYASMLEKVRNGAENTIAYMTGKLKEYFLTVPHKEARTQEKYSLPSGDLVMKKTRAVWNHDDSALMQWVKDNGLADECIKTTERVSWSDVKKRLVETDSGQIADSETGVICEAVTVTVEPPEFKVNL